MQSFVTLLIFCLTLAFPQVQQKTQGARQLFAVRGEITQIKAQGKSVLLITVRPAKEFAEVIILTRENARVGSAVGRAGDGDLIGLLGDVSEADETITAAELNEGDDVSVIYDPLTQNRALEIYLH